MSNFFSRNFAETLWLSLGSTRCQLSFIAKCTNRIWHTCAQAINGIKESWLNDFAATNVRSSNLNRLWGFDEIGTFLLISVSTDTAVQSIIPVESDSFRACARASCPIHLSHSVESHSNFDKCFTVCQSRTLFLEVRYSVWYNSICKEWWKTKRDSSLLRTTCAHGNRWAMELYRLNVCLTC